MLVVLDLLVEQLFAINAQIIMWVISCKKVDIASPFN